MIGFISIAKKRELIQICSIIFFVIQINFVAWALLHQGQQLSYFNLDPLGLTYFVLMSVMGLLTAWASFGYLDSENVRQCKIYFAALILLDVSLVGVYFANNITVSWIFLEATTIAAAGLTYNRRTQRALEATWKYIFVSSVGIAIAYLGILLISSTTPNEAHSLSYDALSRSIAIADPLLVKIAFVLILVGYSTKLEIFPLFTVGVDANHAAPAPTSAFISSALVGGGFIAIFRLYKVVQNNIVVIDWIENLLLLTGILSLIVAVVYMGRTSNYKRLLAYSTVENSAIICLGLGVGGMGVWAAVLHSIFHTIIKGCAFLQLSIIGKIYHKYKIGYIGSYYKVDKAGSFVIMGIFLSLIALPPSILFRSEFFILKIMIDNNMWWLFAICALALLAAMYWICMKFLPILYKPVDISKINYGAVNTALSIILGFVILTTLACGVFIAPQIRDLINIIAF